MINVKRDLSFRKMVVHLSITDIHRYKEMVDLSSVEIKYNRISREMYLISI